MNEKLRLLPAFGPVNSVKEPDRFMVPLRTGFVLSRTMPVRVQSSVKAHLFDGSTVIYPRGVYVANNAVIGVGSRYAVGSSTPTVGIG